MTTHTTPRLRTFVLVALVAASVAALAPAGLSQTTSQKTPTAVRFTLSMDGHEIATFADLGKLESETTAEGYSGMPYAAGDQQMRGRNLPQTVTLRRGVTDGLELWHWYAALRDGNANVAVKDVVLTMFSSKGNALARYALEAAWVSSLRTALTVEDESEMLVEGVTISARHMARLGTDGSGPPPFDPPAGGGSTSAEQQPGGAGQTTADGQKSGAAKPSDRPKQKEPTRPDQP